MVSDWPVDSPILPDGLPYCERCQGLRRVRSDAPVGQPDFGKLLPCPACGAQVAQQRHRRAYERYQAVIAPYTQLRGRALTQTFDSFRCDTVSAAVQAALEAAMTFALDPRGFLVLSGDVGTGKSHLAAAIANFQATRSDPALTLFFIVPALLNLLRSGYKRGDFDTLLTLSQECQLLILDDLGTESQTDWATETLFELVNARYQAWLPTVVVTNCELGDLDPRLNSRLHEAGFVQFVRVVGADYRLTGRAQ